MVFNVPLNIMLTFFMVSLCMYYFFNKEFKYNELENHPFCSSRIKKYKKSNVIFKMIYTFTLLKCIEFGYVLCYIFKLN